MIQKKAAPSPALEMVLVSFSIPAHDILQQQLLIQELSYDLSCPWQLEAKNR